VVGTTPISDAISTVGAAAGFAIDRLGGKPPAAGTVAVIVASLGRDESGPLRAALDAGVGFVGLVASSKRGQSVLAELGLSAEERKRIHTPVGLPLGAQTAEEIALSVLAEVVRAIRVDGLRPSPGTVSAVPAQVLDPICGMTVVVGPDTPHLLVDGVDHWFCGTGCRDAYAAQFVG
jgi:xanthine dehydrogenase accessory factor